MDGFVATVFGVTSDWTSLKRYGPPTKKYKGRRRESDDSEEPRQEGQQSAKENKETKGEVKGFEITV